MNEKSIIFFVLFLLIVLVVISLAVLAGGIYLLVVGIMAQNVWQIVLGSILIVLSLSGVFKRR